MTLPILKISNVTAPKRFLLANLAAVLLGGCAGVGLRGSPSQEALQKMKRVGVLSLLPAKMNHIYIGATAFQDKTQTLDVPGWNVNAVATDVVVGALKSNARFAAVGALKRNPIDPTTPFKNQLTSLLDEVKKEGFDSVVIVQPSSYGNAPGMPAGYGVEKAARLGIAHPSHAYSLAIVSVYDASSETATGWQWAFNSLSGDPNFVDAEAAPWKPNPTEYAKDELAQIQKSVLDLMRKDLKYAVNKLGLL